MSKLLVRGVAVAVVVFAALIGGTAQAQTAGDFRSATSGNWNVAATWERFDGATWLAAPAFPTSADGVITILSTHTVTISAAGLSYDQVVVDAGAQVTVAPTITSTLANGAGTDLTINGTWLNRGGTWTTTGAAWVVGAGGTYIHNTGSAISAPLGQATLDAASNFIYRGNGAPSAITPATSFSGRTYGNLILESTSGTWSTTASGGTAVTVNGNFTLGSGVTLTNQLSGTVTFAGNFTVNGTLTNSTNTQIYTFTGSGKTISGASPTTFETLNVNGAITATSPVTLASTFTGTVTGTLAVGAAFTNSGTMNVNGTFQVNQGGSAAGTAFVYGGSSTLIYAGTSPQTSTNVEFPGGGGPQNVTINNGGGVTLHADRAVNGTFALTIGNLTTNASTLTLGGAATVTGGSPSSYVIGNLRRVFDAPAGKPFPVGTPNGFSPVDANVTAGTTFPLDLTIRAVQGPQPNVNPATSIARFWTITANNGPTADLAFHYLAGDVQGNEAAYEVIRVSGGVPTPFPASNIDTLQHIATLAGVNSFSDWTVGDADVIPPVVTSVSVPAPGTYINGADLDFTVNFSETVDVTNGTPRLPITLDSGPVHAIYQNGSGSTALLFRYTVGNGDLDANGIAVAPALDLNGAFIRDAAQNNADPAVNNVGDTTGIFVDGVQPTVTSITRVGSAVTNATSLDFTVEFSEDVVNLNTDAFTLFVTGTASGAITNVVPVDGNTYTVTITSVSGDGTLRLDMHASGTGVTDLAGNLMNGGFTTGEAYNIDNTTPAVTSVGVPADGTYTNGQNLDFTVHFSENVIVAAGTPRIEITEASGTVYATYESGSGTNALLFRNTVVSGNSDPDGIVLAGSIDLNGGTIRDAATNDANATLNAVGSTTGVLVDANAPSVVSVTRVNAATTNLASVDYTVVFSQSVTGVDSDDFSFTLTGGITGASVTGVTPATGDTYTVTVNTGSGDGTLRLNVDNDGSIQNGTSVPLSAAFTAGEVYTIDKTAPAVQSITRLSFSPANYSPVTFTVTFTEPTFNVGSGDFTSTMGGGVTGSSPIGISGTTGPYTLHVTTGSGNGTIRLDIVAAIATINDAAGNALVADFNTGEVFDIDKTAPVVQSIDRDDADPTSAASVDFIATFSETVSEVTAADFALATSGVTSASITSVTGSGPWTITVNTGSGSGTIGLNLGDDDSITDTATNKLGGTGLGNGNFTGQVYTVTKAPLAPANLAATGGLDSHVPLTWDAANGAVTYNVKRSPTNNTSYTTIATGVAVTSYDDLTAVNGTTYFYKISATNGQGEGPDSNEVSATPSAPLAAPSPVSVAVGNAQVFLSWPAVAGATTYNVKRGTSTGVYDVTTNTASLSFTDSTVTNGTTYFYVVTSVGAGESAPSAEVTATPNTPSVLGVVMSQVYGGGGNSGATLRYDFVELYNRGTQTVSLSGWFVHYTSAASGTWTATNSPTALSGTIAPGRYYLVQEASGANTAAANLPTPDATGNIAMGATGGRVALVGSAAALSGCPTGTHIADFVGYGSAATCFEGSGPTGTTANTSAALRANGGCTDTNNNSADFSVVSQPLTVRNSSTPTNVCGAPNNPPNIIAPADPIASVAQDAAPFTVNLTGSDDGGVYTWGATPGTGVQSVSVSGGQGSANVTYSVTLVAGFSGTATFTASLTDSINAPDTQAVNIQVTGTGGNGAPIITPPADPITTVAQDAAPFTVNLAGSDDGGVYNWSATPGTGIASVNVSAGQGTASVTYTVSLNAGFNGTATFTASLSDNVNPSDTQVVNINVLSAGSTPDHIVISQIYGGGGNSSATYKNDFVELYNPTAAIVNVTGWSIQYSSATNTGAFSGLQPLGGAIGPGEYYLIALASGGAVGADLPAANVSGSINMSGTTGKVALVNNGDVVTGPCATTLADTDIVDLVGYGTANCNEGGTNAPAPSNTTSTLRKNGGNTDTNVNGNDFLAGAPNPRRTAGISEVGPAIVNTDPSTNAPNAPRDASIIVNFTEPVEVNVGWYDINCVTTGNHNDATVAPGAPDSFVITPNENFLAAEQCTVTIFKDFVHDVDLDDSNPNTDTLQANYTWTFTVSTGTAPPFPQSVHLTMGNPSDAEQNLLAPNNYLMEKPELSLSYNRSRGTPNWVSWHLTDEWVGSLTRVDTFRPDPEVPPDWYRVLASDYFSSGFDRGHMVPNADRDKETSIPINQATFLMTNMLPQAPDNNQGPWADMENDLRAMLAGNELYIIAGGAGTGGTGSNGFANTLAGGNVSVPAQTWKVVMILPKAGGDDVARVTASTHTLAVLMPNAQGIRNDDWHNYIVTVDSVEALTGYDFFSNVPDAIEAAIEAGTDGANPPGAAPLSVDAAEDTPEDITLNGVSPSNGTLTYTIVTPPSHGDLTGSDASRTYTPLPDYFGSDSFTYRVNDGTGDSNIATVTITVAEVNDPPSAANDAKNAAVNTPLIFQASNLTTNDSPGPSNESGQMLTVTLVAETADTHGTVEFDGALVTYTPAPNYVGPASFTYTMCDNGVTGGSTSPLCASATVNVVVGCSANTPPPAPITADAAVCAGSTGNHASTTAGGGAYAWTITNGTITAGAGTNSITFTAGQSGQVQLTVAITEAGSCGGVQHGAATIDIRRPDATLPADVRACDGNTVDITATLIGTAPFTVRWKDGLVQSNISSHRVTRNVVVSGDQTYEIDSVTDAFCTHEKMRVRIRVTGEPAPTIDHQTHHVTISARQTATLTVETSTTPVTYQWFQGTVGDVSTPVGSNAPAFTTPALEQTTLYWVRLTSTCGHTDSRKMTVQVNTRRRSSSHR